MVDIEQYGGKRGVLEHIRARTLYALGVYGNIRNIEWTAVRRLVFVCKGNICRSPYASARAQSLGLAAASLGLAARDDAPADPTAARNALTRGVDLSHHRSMRAHPSSFARGDLVIAFEPEHLVEVRRMNEGVMAPTLLGVWTRPIRPHIQDPYGRSDRYFQRCFSLIDANLDALVRQIAAHGVRGFDANMRGPKPDQSGNGPSKETTA